MKKCMFIVFIGSFITINGMQKKEPYKGQRKGLIGFMLNAFTRKQKPRHTYLQLIPAELKEMLYYLAGALEPAISFDEFLENLQNVSKIKGLTSSAQKIYNDLAQIKNLQYGEALQKVKELSKKNHLTPFFDNPDFIRLLISKELYKKHGGCLFEALLEDVAASLETVVVQEVLNELRLLDAIFKRDIRTIQDLLNKGVDVNAKNIDDQTALITATMYGARGIAELLLDHNPDINAQDTRGYTALMKAAYHGHTAIAELLLKKGADVNNARDNSGNTALIISAMCGCQDIVELLINAGSNVNAKNNKGYTALAYAKKAGHKEIEKLLKSHK